MPAPRPGVPPETTLLALATSGAVAKSTPQDIKVELGGEGRQEMTIKLDTIIAKPGAFV